MTTLPLPPRRRAVAAALLLLPFFAPLLRAHALSSGNDMPEYAPTPDALEREAKDAVVERLPGGFAVVLPEPFAAPTPARDERFGWQFSRAVYVYAPPRRGEVSGLFRRVVIHHEPEARGNAVHIARLIARLLRLHREHFHRDTVFPRDADSADIYLAPEKPGGGKIGGETHENQVYIFATGTVARTPLEWTRTVAHEWGHATLPAARGYTEPENDAAGYLGERLYLKWLHEDKEKEAAGDGTRAEDLDLYYRRQIAPLIKRFQTGSGDGGGGGPYARQMKGTFTDDMDYYIGMALACDDAFGSAALGKALFTINGVKASDFRTAFEDTVAAASVTTVRLPAWVPLKAGNYTLTASGSGSVALADRPPLRVTPDKPTPLHTLLSGWKWVRAVSGDVRALTLRRGGGPRS